MKKFIWFILLALLILIGWFTWNKIQEPKILDIFTPAPREIEEVKPIPADGKG